ncbi:MAG: toxin-antitoxin system YwqK family antitoxin [Bacteroidales bacterium]|nr:MAG: toxin-antitoxin system YwqK family antitoxin [Bacteroidales bacterium]
MKQLQYLLYLTLGLFILSSCETQVHRDYYSDGTLKEEYCIRKGKFTGKYKAFYQDGKPHAIGEYRKGKMTGLWQYYYSDGKTQSIQKFTNGKATSIDFWDKDGTQVIKDGTGVAKLYDSSGLIESIMSYKDNVFHGKCETWFPNGIKATELYYEDGKPKGTWRYWNENGELIKTEKY